MTVETKPIKRVAIIGAGASGLASAKAFLAEEAFDTVKVFERNPLPGGLWNFTKYTDEEIQSPTTESNTTLQPRLHPETKNKEWAGPAYDKLTTNVPWSIMLYEHPTYTKSMLFGARTDIADFLHDYSKDINDHIAYGTNVVEVFKHGDEWSVKYQSVEPNSPIVEEKFDAVVSAGGYFNLPFIPDAPGLKKYSEAVPGSVLHSKVYRNPADFKDKTLLVIGNGASAIDISNQVAEQPGSKVYRSVRPGSESIGKPNPKTIEVGPIVKYDADERAIYIQDGTMLKDIDVVFYATGYYRSLPFLNRYNATLKRPIITSGHWLNNIYLHYIYIDDPTLVIIGITRFVIPFRVSQAQACYIARVWDGRLKLPPRPIQDLAQYKRFQEVESPEAVHDLKFPFDADYCEYIRKLSLLAPGDKGIFPKTWSHEERSFRKEIATARSAFSEYNHKFGKLARTREDLEQAGLIGHFELDDTKPNPEAYGKIKNGDQYTQEEVDAAVKELIDAGIYSPDGQVIGKGIAYE
ncbi:hypothetical protein V1514DRAFT_187837 [Lipomyces japonicus]|uniref:uncharacterized protein n=1 Tax=Lipomyces japonicus TaxID=56871 RepID=UPI0034CF7051